MNTAVTVKPEQPEPKAKKPKAEKKYLTIRYQALKLESKEAKELLDPENETQAALIFRLIAKAKQPPTFAEIVEQLKPILKGKKVSTIEANTAWYINSLKNGKGLVKSVESREEAA